MAGILSSIKPIYVLALLMMLGGSMTLGVLVGILISLRPGDKAIQGSSSLCFHHQGQRTEYAISIQANDTARPLNVLFLTTYHSYANHMDRHFYRKYENAKQLPDLNRVYLWGAGFPRYNENTTLKENLRQVFGSECFFDFILWFYPFDRPAEIREMTQVTFCNNIKKPGPIFAQWEHEARDCRAAYAIQEHRLNVSILMMTYCGEVGMYASVVKKSKYPRLVVHMPHSIHAEKFDLAPVYHPFSPGQVNVHGNPRRVDILLIGSRRDYYPLRDRLFPLLTSQTDLGRVETLHHPGYSEMEKAVYGVEDREWQALNYSMMLSNAKICVFDSSQFGYFLQKFQESALAGCLPMADLPFRATVDEYEMLRDFILVVDPDDTDGVILYRTKAMLADEKERLRRVAKGRQAMIDKYDGKRIW
eukprot:CAMPEP_0184698452 /NCGR_PEP_ID=MMETSP0313-20130426/5084_1 /TAXON_ID=2792 /ORGANISM="Porphyridium aerugineum, Strain SAG 1380-2" /LENGTH=417 /DNA_ID=CAMNT_0027157411 /DNA_START=182 /DNA_END=1432 /DNA_ORIENTATION=+